MSEVRKDETTAMEVLVKKLQQAGSRTSFNLTISVRLILTRGKSGADLTNHLQTLLQHVSPSRPSM